KCLEILPYSGSIRKERSVVSIVGRCFLLGSWASGVFSSASLAIHCLAPAGLICGSHSYSNKFLKKLLSHWVGVCVQVTSGPPPMACAPTPVPQLFFQPSPCCSIGAASGSGPTYSFGDAAPWVFPKVCPPAISATVS